MGRAFVRVVFLILLIISSAVALGTASAEQPDIPPWIKNTLNLWSSGQISDQEFVNAIEYLHDNGVLKLSSTQDEEVRRDIEYLKAKNEVVREELKQLRVENEEYRILLKNQEIGKEQFPVSMSKMFDEYQKLQQEVKSLRETNRQFSKQIDSWMNNYPGIDQKVSDNIFDKSNRLTEIEAEYIDKLNNLKQENADYREKITEYENKIKSFNANVEILNGDQAALKEEFANIQHENSEYQEKLADISGIYGEQKNTILAIAAKLNDANKKIDSLNSKIYEYENSLKSILTDKEKNSVKINEIEAQNSKYKERINQLEVENAKQRQELVSIINKAHESDEFATTLNSEISIYKNIINTLENENKQHKTKITELESKGKEKDTMLTSIKNEFDNLSTLASELKSKMNKYDNTIASLKNENTEYKNQIINMRDTTKQSVNESDSLINMLKQENKNNQNEIKTLRDENKILGDKLSLIQGKQIDDNIVMTDLSSENSKLKHEIQTLQSEIKQKQNQIQLLEESKEKLAMAGTKNVQIVQDSDAKLDYLNEITHLTKQNEAYIVELNYLKAKSLVNNEEMDTLREENEEYRVLINLLKKGEKSFTGIESADYAKIHSDDGYGVIMYHSDNIDKQLPQSWINRIDNKKEYTIYVQPLPDWAGDLTPQLNEAIKFWKDTAKVNIKITSTPSSGITLEWKKELPNGYDGFVDKNLIQIGLGNTDCDGKWRAYDKESVKSILIHELGHVLELEHATDKKNIMYPLINTAKFVSIDQTVTIEENDSVFIKTCSFNSNPSYKYHVSSQDTTKKFDLFFVPSKAEKQNVDSNKAFDYYSDISCLGVNKTMLAGTCKGVADSGGLLIVNSENKGSITVKVHLEEK